MVSFELLDPLYYNSANIQKVYILSFEWSVVEKFLNQIDMSE